MLDALFVKNKFGFINGSISKPSQDNARLYFLWKLNINIIKIWFSSFISPTIYLCFWHIKLTHDIWEELKTHYKDGWHLHSSIMEIIMHHSSRRGLSE